MSRNRNSSPAVLELPTGQKAKLECFEDSVLILPDKREDKTPGGIMLPESARSQDGVELRYGKVVAVGPGKMSDNGLRLEPDVKINDRVVYMLSHYTGSTLEHEGKKYDLVGAADVRCRLTPV